MLNMTKCTRLAVLGVAFTNAPTMHLTIKNNTSTTIQGITINTTFPSKNTDGIDIAAVAPVVAGNNISDGDDVIASRQQRLFFRKHFHHQLRFRQWSWLVHGKFHDWRHFQPDGG